MGFLDQLKFRKNRFLGQFQSLLGAPRVESDFVLVYSATAAVLFILLRLQMLRRIIFFRGGGWGFFHDQLTMHDYPQAVWVILRYRRAAFWAIVRQDMLYLATLTVLCLLVCALVSSVRLRRGAVVVYCAVVLISLLVLCANVELAPMYATQLDYSLLRFSGLLSGPTTTLIAMVPMSALLAGALVCASLLVAPWTAFLKFYHTKRRIIRGSFCAIVACGLLAVAAVPVPASIPGLAKFGDRERQNSLAFFLASLVSGPRLPNVDLSTAEPASAAVGDDTIVLPDFHGQESLGAVKNVLVVVLESVGAEYFELLSDNGLLPAFSEMMSRGVYFKNAYASAPISNVSLVAMLTSTGPLGSYKLVTSDYPRARLTTSYEKFKSRGFATGFFWSNDSTFLGIDDFLQDRGIDLNQDYRQRTCPESRELMTDNDSLPYTYSADTCTASSLLNWIDGNGGKPFFATLWTEQTHYRYAASRQCTDAIAEKGEALHPEDMNFAGEWPRYAAALCDSDQMMAKIVSGLQQRQLFENTLVVVVGDHGEGFGQHGTFGHGSEIFENDVRVPLLISAGHALTERVDSRLAGHLDIAPTIAAVFGMPAPDQWEGHDLLGSQAPRRVYFYTGWGNYKIGYREANNKYIYDVLRQNLSAYDLATDPHETKTAADKDPEADAKVISLIDQWYLQRARFGNTLY
jgi:lipoteichoic acid synthase